MLKLRNSLTVAVTTSALSLGFAWSPGYAQAQCEGTGADRVCKVEQQLIGGAIVPNSVQKQLGLVHVGSGCSGALLNRYWVLTARHCVSIDGSIDGPLMPPGEMRVTADWADGRVGIASRFHEFGKASPGWPTIIDLNLIYLGTSDLGPVNTQELSRRRLQINDTVTHYGQGYSKLATGVYGGTPPAKPAEGLGIYRSAEFTPTKITALTFELAKNGSGQVGFGGDSGGPGYVTTNGIRAGIAGVTSIGTYTYLKGAPDEWKWVDSVSVFQFASVEPFVAEILQTIRESPECDLYSNCALPVIIDYVLRQ